MMVAVRTPGQLRTPWAAVAALAVVTALLAGLLLARPVASVGPGVRPSIRISVDQSRTAATDFSEGTPTAIVSFADGTHGDASAAVAGPWTPEKPVTMLVVVAQSACNIIINERLEVTDGAAINRLAVCVWRP
jgi:hypothetical protein